MAFREFDRQGVGVEIAVWMTVDPHLADPNTAFWQDIGFLQKFCGFSKINEFELNFFKPVSDLVEDAKISDR